jgi:hypothetical protein
MNNKNRTYNWGRKEMDIRIGSIARSLSTMAVLATACGVTQVQAAEALSIVVDSRGEIYRVNYLCDTDPDCAQSLERLTNAKVKQGASVAIGSISGGSPINYVFVGNAGRRGEIKLLTQQPDLTSWNATSFSSGGTTAMVVTRNSGTLYVARQNHIEAFKRDSTGGAGYDANVDFVIDPVEYPGGPSCQDIVGLEEWPAFSGNLIAICDAPTGAISINIDEDDGPGSGTPAATLVAPNSLGVTLSGGGITRVPVPSGIQPDGLIDYLLLSSSTKEIIAVDLDRIRTQRNLVNGSGQVRDLAPALCNFPDPGNNVDDDDDVDGPCFSFTQSGNSGDVILAELVYDPVGDRLQATVVEQIDDGLKNTYGIDFINKSTVLASTCVPPGCDVGFSLLVINPNLPFIPENSFGVETRGPFYDSRFVQGSDPQRCDSVELPLDFTNIPMLENFSIGPEFCSRDGFFFVDVVADDGVLGQPILGGISSWETPGSCWEPGPLPFVSLDEVEYGVLSGDQFDLLRIIDDVLEPIDPPGTNVGTTYVNNRFVQDRLVGCATRRRAGSRLTFLIDDLFGNDLDTDIGMAADPLLPGTILFDFGARELDESFDLLSDATQSGCSVSPSDSACTDFGTGNAQAAFGWSSQQYAGMAETVDIVIPGSTPTATFVTAKDVDVKLVASGGGNKLGNKTVGGITAVGVTQGGAGNELSPNGNELITATFSTAVREFQVNDVPMVIKSFTGAFLYDGPYGDVNEYLIVTAVPADGSPAMVGILKAEGSGGSEAPTWALDTGVPMPATSVHSGGGVIQTPEYPFGNKSMTSLTFEASTANDCGSGGCDGSLSDIEVEIPSRIDNLAYSYNGLLKALCPTSDRPNFVGGDPTPSRPKLCAATSPNPFAFNSPGRRNMSGELHATTEALARFISHNICQLDFSTDVDPGDIGLGAGEFCTTPAEWSIRPTPPTP